MASRINDDNCPMNDEIGNIIVKILTSDLLTDEQKELFDGFCTTSKALICLTHHIPSIIAAIGTGDMDNRIKAKIFNFLADKTCAPIDHLPGGDVEELLHLLVKAAEDSDESISEEDIKAEEDIKGAFEQFKNNKGRTLH